MSIRDLWASGCVSRQASPEYVALWLPGEPLRVRIVLSDGVREVRRSVLESRSKCVPGSDVPLRTCREGTLGE